MYSAGGNRCSRSRRARDRQSGSALRSAVRRSTLRASGLRYAASRGRRIAGGSSSASGAGPPEDACSNRSLASSTRAHRSRPSALRRGSRALRPPRRQSAHRPGDEGRRATGDRRCREWCDTRCQQASSSAWIRQGILAAGASPSEIDAASRKSSSGDSRSANGHRVGNLPVEVAGVSTAGPLRSDVQPLVCRRSRRSASAPPGTRPRRARSLARLASADRTKRSVSSRGLSQGSG